MPHYPPDTKLRFEIDNALDAHGHQGAWVQLARDPGSGTVSLSVGDEVDSVTVLLNPRQGLHLGSQVSIEARHAQHREQ